MKSLMLFIYLVLIFYVGGVIGQLNTQGLGGAVSTPPLSSGPPIPVITPTVHRKSSSPATSKPPITPPIKPLNDSSVHFKSSSETTTEPPSATDFQNSTPTIPGNLKNDVLKKTHDVVTNNTKETLNEIQKSASHVSSTVAGNGTIANKVVNAATGSNSTISEKVVNLGNTSTTIINDGLAAATNKTIQVLNDQVIKENPNDEDKIKDSPLGVGLLDPAKSFIDTLKCLFTCPNGDCALTQAECLESIVILPRCPLQLPIRCSNDTCISGGKCDIDLVLNTNTEYDGCPIGKYQCPNGKCKDSESLCDQCENGLLKCFDNSCLDPCPLPPYYYKPISLKTNILKMDFETLVPIRAHSTPSNYSSPLDIICDIYIQPNTFPKNTSLYINAVADSVIEKVSGEEYWSTKKNDDKDDDAFQLKLISPVINITAYHNEIEQSQFNNPVRFEFNNLGYFTEDDVNSICLAYIDEKEMVWKCVQDKVIITKTKIIGFTTHFTSFALITTYMSDEPNGMFSTKNIPMILGIVFGSIGACGLVVTIGVILHYSSKHGGVRYWFIAKRTPKTTGNSSRNSAEFLSSSSASDDNSQSFTISAI